ncbi:group 1 glycosyl transferase [Salinisphaera sp. C84B14]|uniref:glycosyltransferase n=1 Tax=Salinisphaera sp. C84B14 TaxID=1304155 RepID=UPI00333FAE05
MSLERLLHYVSLDGAGGVEQQFVDFVHAARQRSRARHAVVACGQGVHPLVAARLDQDVPVVFEKYAGGVKLPKWPRALRRQRQRHIVERNRPDVVLIWNRLRDSLDTLAAAGAERCIYWERGASWFAGESPAKRDFLAAVPAIICNSHAAQRMLELRWGYAGQVRVIHNALRPSLLPAVAPEPRRSAGQDALTLGVVARLESIKGVAVALHALARLIASGYDATLRIAGDGPEHARLRALAQRLNIADRVVFEGMVADMAAFYARIDLLVHPALREPFGQIAVEAGAYGVPAVVSAVDGLVEVIEHERTGLCIEPTLDAADYRALGGDDAGLPPFVYDPARDTIAAPRALDPETLCRAIMQICNDDTRYARMSEAGLRAARERFVFDNHVRDALASIESFRNSGRLAPAW